MVMLFLLFNQVSRKGSKMKKLVSLLVCLACSSASGQIADIDVVALQQFKIKQTQNLDRFKQDQENALQGVIQQQVLTHLLEQVEHQKALVLQLGGEQKVLPTTSTAPL